MKAIIDQNTEKRVSEESAKKLGEVLDEWSTEIGEEAVEIAAKDGRKTVRAEDIKKAINKRKSTTIEEKISI